MCPCWSFIKHVCLCAWSVLTLILSGMWSYKQLALNSIYKINSPRAAAAHISLLPSSRPPPLFSSSASPLFIILLFLKLTPPISSLLFPPCSPHPWLYLALLPPPPAHSFPGYYWPDWALCGDRCSGSWSSWGSPSSGHRVIPERSEVRLWSDGWSWHHPKGTCMCESPPIRPDILWPVFGPTSSLSLCHPSPSCSNKAPVCVDLRFSFSWLAKLPNAPCFIWIKRLWPLEPKMQPNTVKRWWGTWEEMPQHLGT